MFVQVVKRIIRMKNKWLIVIILIIVIGGTWFALSNRDVDQNAGGQSIGTSVGDLAPNYAFTTISGESISSTDLSGKTVVITSSAAWCNTCVTEAKEFAKVYPNFSRDDVVFITADIDSRNSIDAIEEFKITTSSPWHYTNATGGADLVDKLKLSRFEITYVIDGDGVIQYKDSKITSSEELTEAINKTL